MPRLDPDPVLTRARDGVRAIALGRLHARGAGRLRAEVAAGEISADEIYRDAVREWVRSGLAAHAGQNGSGVEMTDGAYEHLLALSARWASGGEVDVVLERSRTARRSRAGAFYTPAPLIEWLLGAALDPAIADVRARRAGDRDAVLSLRVCDPACGSGRVLVAAARRLAGALAADRAGGGDPSPGDHAAAMRDVVRSCLFGVDIDDIAVDLCRAALAGLVDGSGLARGVKAALEAHIRVADALLGATPGVLGAGGARAATRRSADAWCAGFFSKAERRERAFFHWFLEFPASARGIGATRAEGAGSFDVILGNPPFLNQLQTSTATEAGVRALLRERFGGAVRGYADVAAAFLLLATELARPGGRIGLVLPRSLLAVEHASRVRAAVLAAATPTALWAGASRTPGEARSHGFAGTNVATCALALHKGGARRVELRRASGTALTALAPIEIDAGELAASGGASWSHLFADADGVPRVTVRTTRTIADLANATADFRDQYYGLQGFIVDSPEAGGPERRRPKLITSGLIAPLESLWGRVPTRVHKRKWLHPRVDLDALDRAARTDPDAAKLAAWARARLVPKLLLATQTRVLEVLPDPEGELLPCVPVITIVPKAAGDLSLIAAAMSAPAMSAVAMTRYAGAGMSVDAIKLSAKQVMALPLMDGDGTGGLDAGTLALVSAWWSGRVKGKSDDSRPGSAKSGRPRASGPALARGARLPLA